MGRAGVLVTPAIHAETPAPIIQPWPSVAPASTAAPTLDAAPEPAAKPQPAVTDPTPAASLDRPVAIRDKANVADGEVQPTGLFSGRNNETIANSPATNFISARPLPVGIPAQSSPAPLPSGTFSASPPPPDVPYSWQQPPTTTPAPQGSSSSPLLPMPSAMPTPLSSGGPTGIMGGPIGNPVSDGCMANGCCADGCCAPGCCSLDGCGAGCGDGCGCGWGGCGNGCCFGNRWYVSAEYLLWFIRGQPLPALLTSGSVNDNPPGALGQPGTTVLLGNNTSNYNPLSGFRIRGGWWLNDSHTLGIDLGGFMLSEGVNRFSASSTGSPFLARPFTNALTGAQDIEAVATPNGLSGAFSSVNTSQLWGGQANLRSNLCCGCNWFIDGLAGFRYLGLHDSLRAQENLAVISSQNPNLPVGSTFVVTDRFSTQNNFYGGQIGGIGEYRIGRWSVDLRTTVAFGVTQQSVDISGTTLTQAPGLAPQLSQGGLLAQSSNIGHHTHDQFSVVPEIGINLGYQFTNHIRGFVGYNFLYWSSVARAGNQVDPVVNPNLLPPSQPGGPARPTFEPHGSDFWAQGINFGLDIRW